MIRLLKNDNREADYFLNYPRNVASALDLHTNLGYTGFGEPLYPVEVSEDGRRVGLTTISIGEQ